MRAWAVRGTHRADRVYDITLSLLSSFSGGRWCSAAPSRSLRLGRYQLSELFAHFDLDTAKKRMQFRCISGRRFINFELVLVLHFRVPLVETLNSVLYFKSTLGLALGTRQHNLNPQLFSSSSPSSLCQGGGRPRSVRGS